MIAVFGLGAQNGWACLAPLSSRPLSCPGSTATWRLVADTVLPALLTGAIAAIYAVGFLRDEFPDVYREGVGRLTPAE